MPAADVRVYLLSVRLSLCSQSLNFLQAWRQRQYGERVPDRAIKRRPLASATDNTAIVSDDAI